MIIGIIVHLVFAFFFFICLIISEVVWILQRVEAVGVSSSLNFRLIFRLHLKNQLRSVFSKQKGSGDLPKSPSVPLCWTGHGYLVTRSRQNAGRVSTPETCQDIYSITQVYMSNISYYVYGTVIYRLMCVVQNFSINNVRKATMVSPSNLLKSLY